MKRILIILVALGLFAVGGAASVALADKPPAPPGKDPCSHGNTGKPCRPDPQPDRGKDCEKHGKEGGVNEDHCKGETTPPTTTTTTTTGKTTTQETTTSTTSTPTTPSTSTTPSPTTTTPAVVAPVTPPTKGKPPVSKPSPSKPDSSPNPPPPGATPPSAGTLPFTS